MLFKPLPPGVAQRLIQNHPDALTPLVKERDFSIKNSKCLRCGGAMQTRMHPNFLFSGDDPLPRRPRVRGHFKLMEREPERGPPISMMFITR